ncbi:hypothetical protein BCV70DRAFT_202218 [Testicularia cyperi]|uniref:Uncharacterized protein n=1 Tax=Testicularia cyperi TaxID=1882483 RepID=A0A317XKT2_9BASI|nr:hypothetical protein BCV70DRAFT_202218 [Testicularia cyperi]
MASTSASASASASTNEVEVCIVNPNSSVVITEALEANLSALAPPGCRLRFATGPSTAPESIQDVPTSIISAAETYKSLLSSCNSDLVGTHPSSAFLVACFSDHPLVGMLRTSCPSKASMHLLEAAVLHAMACGNKFGVLTTGRSVVPDIDAGIRKILGGNSDRYVGTHATGLGVVELQTGDRAKVEGLITAGAQDLVTKGADAIILGCAGMVGMEPLVRSAAKALHPDYANIAVIDGAKAGLQLLAGLARSNYRS